MVADSAESDRNGILRQREIFGQLFDTVPKPIPPQKQNPALLGQCGEETVNGQAQFPGIQGVLQAAAGQNSGQLIQRNIVLAAAFLRAKKTQLFQSEIPTGSVNITL